MQDTQGTTADKRFDELYLQLSREYPDPRWLELSDAHGHALVEAEAHAIEHHGKVVLAAITGKLQAWPDSMPDWAPGFDANTVSIAKIVGAAS